MTNDELIKQTKVRLQVIGSIIIDGIFLLCWLFVTVFIAHMTDKVITKYELSGIDAKMFIIFQWLFSGSTFIAVVSFLIKDIWTIFMKTQYEILQISQKNKNR